MGRFATKLSDLVEKKADELLKNPTGFAADDDNYLKRWTTACLAYLTDQNETTFLHARFGYAVESLVTLAVKTDEGGVLSALGGRYRPGYQVSIGSTRPDIVLYDQDDKDVAWFDITSADSVGHIDDKQHTGWKTRPSVAEICYPALVLGKLLENGIGDQDKLEETKAAREQMLADNRRAAETLKKLADGVYEDLMKDAKIFNNKANCQKFFEKELCRRLDAHGVAGAADLAKLPPSAAKYLLAHLERSGCEPPEHGFTWWSSFGYTDRDRTGRKPALASRLLSELADRIRAG